MSKHTPGPPLLNKRRPYEDSKPQGYTESDRDYIENNKELCLWFLDNYHLSAAAPELLQLVKDMREAFYVKGTRKALLAVMERSKSVMEKAEGREV